MKLFRIAILSLFVLFVLTALMLESKPGKWLVQKGLIYALKRSGYPIEVGSLSGNLPQQMDLQNVRIRGIDGYDISIQTMHVKLALLPLLGLEVRIQQLEADQIRFEPATLTGSGQEQRGKPPFARLPMSVSIRSMRLAHVQWPQAPELEIRGEGAVRRRGSAYIDIDVKRYDMPEATLNLIATRSRFGKYDLSADFDAPTLSALKPWIDEQTVDGAVRLRATAKGTLDEFTGAISGRFQGAHRAELPLLQREWSFKTRILKQKHQPMRFPRMRASTRGMKLQGSAELDETMHLSKAQWQLRSELQLLELPLKASGPLFAKGEINRNTEGLYASAQWSSEHLIIERLSLQQVSGSIDGLLGERSFVGKAEANAALFGQRWSFASPIVYRKEAPVMFEKVHLESPLLRAHGDLSLRNDDIWVGTVIADEMNLQLLSLWDQRLKIFGFASGKCLLQASETEPPVQEIRLDWNASQPHFDKLYAYQAKVSGHWRAKEMNHLLFELMGARYGRFTFDSALFETTGETEQRPARLALVGNLKTPLELNLEGFWQQQNSGFALTLDSAQGTIFHHDMQLLQPSHLEYHHSKISWDRLYLSFGNGLVDVSLEHENEQTAANLHLQNIPLDILSFNPLETRVSGSFNADVQFQQRGNATEGQAQISLRNGHIQSEGAEPLVAEGTLDARLQNDRLHLKTNLEVPQSASLTMDLQMPFAVVGWPPRVKVSEEAPIFGALLAQGQVEDLLDFFNLGMHRLEGDCGCDIKLTGTLAQPHLEGSCRLIDGYYQNYLTGTEITHIAGTFQAEQDRLVLRSFTAQDKEKKGQLTASGDLLFSLKRHFPFQFEFDFTRLHLVQIDLIDAEAQGHVTIAGNWQEAKVQGRVEIVESDIAIPDKIARSYPDLKVVYKNGPPPVETPTALHIPYPLELDLQIQAPEGIFIGGRGLTSEWKGDFAIGGTYAEPAVIGQLELINGQFVFAGRQFKLIDGSISMKGNQYKMPVIDISANTSEKGISITARLKGPLNHPQITFQSAPPLPLSGILSYLLFGKDLSEVNGLQALQLAGTVASVAGEGPDILEITRKSLGVDRLQIVMTPSSSGEAGAETIALQVGKVLTPGLVITVRQGADDSSPNLGIEIDLTNGFTFEGESQQQPEQGKFSLKWNLNY